MKILENLDKDNLHHAYLIEGDRDKIIPDILSFLKNMGIETSKNPDFCHISVDSFKIDDARNLKSIQYEKSFSANEGNKKIFLISANNFLLEAQNTLLKIFEEPIKDTHFFVILPDKNLLLKTLISRFYLISDKQESSYESQKEIEEFLKMSLKNRLDFIKELISEDNDEEITHKSTRHKALNFLNTLEDNLSKKDKTNLNFCFEHILKVRQFLNQPGSSVKTLMESVALFTPIF